MNLIEGGHVNRMSEELKQDISNKTKEAMQDPKIREKCAYWDKHDYPKEAGSKISMSLLEYYKTHPGHQTGKKLWPNGRTFSEEWHEKQRAACNTIEHKEEIRNRVKQMWDNMTPEERKARGQKIKEARARKKSYKKINE